MSSRDNPKSARMVSRDPPCGDCRASQRGAKRKRAPTGAPGEKKEVAQKRWSAGLLGLLGTLLLDLLDLLKEVIGLLLQAGALVVRFDHVGFATIKEVEVGHGVVVVRARGDSPLQLGDAFIDHGAGLGDVFGSHRGGKWR